MKSSDPPACRASASPRACEWKYSRSQPSVGCSTPTLWQSPPSAEEAGDANSQFDVVQWSEIYGLFKAALSHLRYVASYSRPSIPTGKPVGRSKSLPSKLPGPKKHAGTEPRRTIENRKLE